MAKREVKSIDGFEKELLSESERVELFISKYWLKIAIASLIVIVIGVAVYAFMQRAEKETLDDSTVAFLSSDDATVEAENSESNANDEAI